MKNFFRFDEHQTSVRQETLAGITTFFAMSYIIFVNPSILSETGMPYQGVFAATVLSTAIATVLIGLIANVPYALAPALGLNTFFAYTVVFQMGFTWQEALAMVFICGLFNIVITVTKFRYVIIKAIPESLQHAISGGIGIFVAYIGLKNANFIDFIVSGSSIVSVNGNAMEAGQEVFEGGLQSIVTNGETLPALTTFMDPMVLIGLAGLIITVILLIKNVKGAILLGILGTTLISYFVNPDPILNFSFTQNSLQSTFNDFSIVFGSALGSEGLGSLFADPSRYPIILVTLFAFSITDVFDTIGTFIGTGVKSGIFNMSNQDGNNIKFERALFGDSIGTSIGAVLGTSNVSTFVESSAGIAAGGRTGFTSVITAFCFLLALFLSPVVSLVPAVATAPALIIVGIMMMSSFADIDWVNLEVAIPAFFASVFMGLSFSISYGIAAGFFFYCVVKGAQAKWSEVHPVIYVTVCLFILNFIVTNFI